MDKMAVKELPPCSVCGKEVTPEEGMLWIRHCAPLAVWLARREWDTAHPGPHTMNELHTRPERAHWKWGHVDCCSDDPGIYGIEYSRFDTVSKALCRTMHFLEAHPCFVTDADWRETVGCFYDIYGV